MKTSAQRQIRDLRAEAIAMAIVWELEARIKEGQHLIYFGALVEDIEDPTNEDCTIEQLVRRVRHLIDTD